ncbi:hypothetical protein AX774_g4389 [Zancudomyces culisetae]|uniref:Uncharacterized protein n=1 Tax=Zancudomyces culisetae TaxID=1213189 RepID=A0A1R1PME1_ZANCU|nr:hypothetical protein AX774_g4389 [Zancudomyces culisetae]|eukprot:OMH82138.1 hypothetical protein AX774_g4389 [Zancudomyces culisetae]
MYVVIDRNTSAVVYKGTLFMNEGEYLDVDIGSLFLENSESEKDLIDIKISHSLYFRPLLRVGEVSANLICIMDCNISGKRDIEMLIDICNTEFEFHPEVCSSVGRNIRCIDNKYMAFCILMAARECCRLNSLDFLKRILDIERDTNIPFEVLQSVVDTRGMPIDYELSAFV